MTQDELAHHIGVSRPMVTQWETGRSPPGRDHLDALGAFFGVSVDSLLHPERSPFGSRLSTIDVEQSSVSEVRVPLPSPRNGRDVPSSGLRGVFENMPIDVPVIGVVLGAQEGEFSLSGQIMEYVPRPQGIASARNVFALWVSGDSMSPKFEPGDLIYVHPGRQPRPGDDVVVELRPEPSEPNGRAHIKRLVKRTSDELILMQFNPPRQLTIAVQLVKAVMLILTTADLMGV